MAKYSDTGANDNTHSLGHWLDTNLIPGIREFHAQFAYFTYTALRPYADTLKTAALAGFPVHIVLGSNEKSLVAGDLRQVLKIVENAANASLTVVAYSNAKFHPKTVQVVRPDGSFAAVVGSGNFTHRGLGLNVEAGLALDSADSDDVALIRQVADAIDRWHLLAEPGVFPVRVESDIQALLSASIIAVVPPPRQPSVSPSSTSNTRTGNVLGTRQRLWTPPVSAAASASSPPTPTAVTVGVSPVTVPVPATVGLPAQKWYKLMKASDAQQNAGHKIAQLRLTKSVFAIDFRRFFRYDLFGGLTWTAGMKSIHAYEYAEAAFDVHFPNKPLGRRILQLHYAPHQEQSQNNYTSVLYWDEALKLELTSFSYVGYWVVIERNEQEAFSLTIQSAQP